MLILKVLKGIILSLGIIIILLACMFGTIMGLVICHDYPALGLITAFTSCITGSVIGIWLENRGWKITKN